MGKWRNLPRSMIRLVPVTSQFPLGARHRRPEDAPPVHSQVSGASPAPWLGSQWPPHPPRAASSHLVNGAWTAGEEGGSAQRAPNTSGLAPAHFPTLPNRTVTDPRVRGVANRQSAPSAPAPPPPSVPPCYLLPRHTR